jgi:hypothetical protein
VKAFRIVSSSIAIGFWGTGVVLAQAPVAAALPPIPVAQAPATPLPFGIGEELVYQVRSQRFGQVGTATLRVEGPETVRGTTTFLLHFELKGRVGPFSIEDHTRSWIDPRGLVSLRYEKRERHPLATRHDAVEIFPHERRWEAKDGQSGTISGESPLDELSFIYLLRSLDLEGAEREISVDRHYQAERNPVQVQLISREDVTLPVGIFPALVVEMRVRDGRRFNGSGVIRLHLTDDAHRYPLRIETSFPVVGTMILDLQAVTPAVPKALVNDG